MARLLLLLRNNKWTASLGAIVATTLVLFGFESERAESIATAATGLLLVLAAGQRDTSVAVAKAVEESKPSSDERID
jgi:hypothetical protein